MDKEEDMEESLAAQWIERYFCDRMWTPEIEVYAGVVRLSRFSLRGFYGLIWD
jgi:hypothetical protein